jgi:hypothetical protein
VLVALDYHQLFLELLQLTLVAEAVVDIFHQFQELLGGLGDQAVVELEQIQLHLQQLELQI